MRENAFSIPVHVFKPSSCEIIFFLSYLCFWSFTQFSQADYEFLSFLYILEPILIESKQLSCKIFYLG